MQRSWLDTGLVAFGYTAQTGILAILWRRHWAGRFAALFAYVRVTLIGSVVLLYGNYHWSSVFAGWFYWGKEAVIYVFSFLLVISFWKRALESFRGVWSVLRTVLPVFFLAVLALLWWNAVIVPAHGTQQWAAFYMWIVLANQALALSQAVFLVGLFVVLNLFRAPAPLLVKRLAACFFVFVVIKIAVNVAAYTFASRVGPIYIYGPAVGFCALMAAWCWLFWAAREEDLYPPQPPSWAAGHTGLLAGNLEDINRELSRLLKV